MSNIYDENENIDYIKIEQNQDFIVQPSLKSLVSSTKYLNNKVHKYKSEKARIKQLEHDVYENDGHINTGSITLHQNGIIDYDITDDSNPKTIASKKYVDEHTNIDINKTLELKNTSLSLKTEGLIQIGSSGGTSIETIGNIIVKNLNDDDVIKLLNNGNIKAKNIEINGGTINNYPINNNDIVNKEYVDSKFSSEYVSKVDENEQTIEGPIKFNETIKIQKDTDGIISFGNIIIKDTNDDEIIKLSNEGNIKANNIEVNGGKINTYPVNDEDITNKKFVEDYVDEKFSTDYLSKIDTNLQTVSGPINFESTITIDNGTIDKTPEDAKDITNKNYVDTTIENKTLLKDKNDEQTVNGPVKFNNISKFNILSLPIVE